MKRIELSWIAKAVIVAGTVIGLAVVGCASTPGQTPQTCDAGETLCGKECIDTVSDPANCGACGTACKPGEVCGVSVCSLTCGVGSTMCGASCLDTNVDAKNCGGCGQACSAGQICAAGKCAAQCPVNQALCIGDGGAISCINPATDTTNCGGCGNVCAAGKVCSAGACGDTCGVNEQLCKAMNNAPYCSAVQTDNNNCGTCGNVCSAGQTCVGGKCTGNCGLNETLCPGGDGGVGYCAKTDTDQANCGACGTICNNGNGEICVNGKCQLQCGQGLTQCGKECVDISNNRDNCGACNAPCPGGKSCFNKMCTVQVIVTALVCGAPSTPAWSTDVQTKLMATGAFSKVDVMACNTTTPTLNQLQAYQSVLAFSDTSFQNAATLGDNLADYVAGGGYAVVAVFANASVALGGKWISQGYNLIQASGQSQPSESLALNILDNSSPLVINVKTLTATSGFKSSGGAVNGGVVVAQWGSGAPLIVRGVKNGRNRAEINLYPPSSTVRNDFWAGDGAIIMKNALIYR